MVEPFHKAFAYPVQDQNNATMIQEECTVRYASLHSHLPLLIPVMYSVHYPKKLLLSYFPARVIPPLADIYSDGHPYIKARTTGHTST